MRGMMVGMADDHRRILEHNEADVGDHVRVELGAEGLAAVRLGMVVDECFAGDLVPIREPITRMHLRGRE
jgi:hypothetical protein